MALLIPHFLKDFTNTSFLMPYHQFRTQLLTSIIVGFFTLHVGVKLPPAFWIYIFHSSLIRTLNGLLIETSSGSIFSPIILGKGVILCTEKFLQLSVYLQLYQDVGSYNAFFHPWLQPRAVLPYRHGKAEVKSAVHFCSHSEWNEYCPSYTDWF